VTVPLSTPPRTRAIVFPGSPRLDDLVSDRGERWEDVRHRLVARYGTVWRDIALAGAALGGGLIGHAALAAAGGHAVGLATVPLAALWVGFWIASLVNFVHEAAHFNLHPSKQVNDRLAAFVLCPLTGTDIARYRDLHWQHHLHLGTAQDTEVSYRHAPNRRFVLRSLFGLQILEVVLRQRRTHERRGATRGRGPVFALARSAALHGAVVGGAVLAGSYSSAVAWALGVGGVYPCCTALRQILEHRPDDAGMNEGEQVGAVNRLFGTDLLSRTFGSAGFNRHLLHHWHPSASYTCFDDFEAFLLRTPLAPALDAARTTYRDAWQRLARS
jgi:fatty acid desaturase